MGQTWDEHGNPVSGGKSDTPRVWDESGSPVHDSPSPSSSLPVNLGHIYTPPLRDSGFFSENGFGPGTFSKGIGEIIQPGSRKAGLHHMMVGAGEMASPLIIPAAFAAPAATATGLVGGAVAGGAGKIGSEMAGADTETSDLIGDVSGLAGGYGAAKFGDMAHRVATSPAVHDAALKFSPYRKFADLGSAILDAVHGSPESIAARTMPAIGPRESVALPSGRMAPVLPFEGPSRTVPFYGPGSRIGQNPFAEPLDPPQLVSGRQPGGTHNATAPSPPLSSREAPLWQQYGAAPHARPVPDFTSVSSELPSGRYPVSSRDFTGSAQTAPIVDVPTVEEIARSMGTRGKLTPADIQAATNVQNNLRNATMPSYKPEIESRVIATEPAVAMPVKDTPTAVRERVKTSRAKFDENGKRNQLKK